MPNRTLVVMVKEPRPGRVKTRLARDIGPIAATWWVRHQTRRLLRRLEGPSWQLVLGVAPDTALRSRAWSAHLPRVAQGPGDLGPRMARLLTGFRPGPTIVIGSDIPGVQPAHIARAFRALGRHDAVFGPASDGGSWLVGLKGAAPPTLFQGVRWSSEHALQDSIATLPGRRIVLTDTLQDVDTATDLVRAF